MKWIGLTGGLASGKSTVSRFFLEKGVPVIDADRIASQVVEKGSAGLKSVVDVFGKNILDPNGSLDRLKVAQIVFSNLESLKKLEAIIHPLVQAEVQAQKKWLSEQGTDLAIYDVPLLFEKKLESQFDSIIVVSCSEEQQIERLKKRNNWSEAEIQNRMKAQIPLHEKVSRANYVINNDADLKSLEKKVDDLIRVLKE